MAQTLIQYIAAHTVYSRRKAGDVIKSERVKVNDEIVTKPWHELKPNDTVTLDGEEVLLTKKVYLMLNKPEGVITTMSDDEGRANVSMLIKGAAEERLFPIGRLDVDTTGLLLLTNDGHLAQKLAHPKYKVSKQYFVTLDRPVQHEHLAQMCKGVYLPDGKVRTDKAVYVPKKHKFVVMVELHSGKKRVIRRIFGKFGYIVKKLDRVGYAGLTKKGLLPGKWRHLTSFEVAKLKKA